MGGKQKIGKIAAWFLAALVVLLIAGAVLAWLKAPEFIKKEASAFVHKKSDGLYHLSIEKIKPEFFPFAFEIKGIEFTPLPKKTKRIQQNLPGKTIYTFTSQSIRFEDIDFGKLWKEKHFRCRKILVSEPVIEIQGGKILQNDSEDMADKIVAEIRPFFKDYLKQLSIDQIEFSDANFGIYGPANATLQKSQAQQVMLEIKGFRTDSAMIFRTNRFFETDDVLVKMTDFRNNMGDSLHITTIDTLEYSLKSTDIRALGFHLFPLYSTAEKNLFDVTVPEVYVKSKSITHFALNDSLKISLLKFNNPEIRFYHKKNREGINLEKLDNFDLYTLVQNQFKKMEIDSFFLKSAQLEIYQQPDTVNFHQQFGTIDIRLEGFALDSTSSQNRDKLFHADNLEMQVGDYQLRLKGNQHEFSADSLFVSTFTNRLGLNRIKIVPSPENFTARTEITIRCDQLNIEDVDFKKLYYTRQLPTSKIEISKPEVSLEYHLERQKQQRRRKNGLLYEMISDYLLGVYSNLVYIDDGKMSIRNKFDDELQGYFETDFTFSLTDFTLDSTSLQRTDKFFYATNFELEFTNYNMRLVDNLHKLETDQILISSLSQHVQIKNLQLEPVPEYVTTSTMQRYNRSELFNIHVPEINLDGVDLNNAFFDKKLKIHDFKISRPDIYFENFGSLRSNRQKVDLNEFYQLIFNYIEDFDINRFTAPNGEITWVNHTKKGKTTSFDNEFSASLFNFRLNKNELNKQRLFFSDNFDISIKDQLFELSDSVHILKAGEIRLSSVNSTLSIKDGLLYPVITSPKYAQLPTTFQAAIPELKIGNLNFQEAYYSKNPKIGFLKIDGPKFQIYNQSGKAKSLELSKYQFPLPRFIDSLKLDEFKITNAKVINYETKGIDHRAQGSFNFDLTLPGVTVANEGKQASFKSANILLDFYNFRVPVGGNHSLAAERVIFNQQKESIAIHDLKVESFSSGAQNNRFNIRAPKINFSNFKLHEAINSNQFNFHEINIVNPSVDIAINKKPEKDTLEFLQTLDLFPYVEPYLNQIKVNNLNLKSADVNFNWLEKKLFDNKVNLEFKNILIAENQPPSGLLNSEEFEISTSDLQTQTKDGLYEFTAGTLSYNSAKHRVKFTDIAILPLVKKEKFPVLKGFQTDVINAEIAYAEVQGIDEKRWLKENVIDAGALKIGPASLRIFRNKRFPFNQQQRPAWPQDLIKEIEQPFVFDSVKLMPSDVIYSELTTMSDEPGIVEFQDLAFEGGKISNIPEVLNQHNFFTLSARASLYGESLLKTHFNFDMTSPRYFHTVTGSLSPMKLGVINKMLKQSAPMIIEQGQLNRFEFELTLGAEHSEGLLFMGYDNLKIAVLDYDGKKQSKARLASFWANKMILNSENPKGETLEPVSIYYERDKKRSIINYWWKSLYSGVRKVIGVEQNE